MYNKNKTATWIHGQIELENGEVLHFEYSPDPNHGGGQIKIGSAGNFGSRQLMTEASGLFGTKLKELLIGGKLLFSGLREMEAKKLESSN